MKDSGRAGLCRDGHGLGDGGEVEYVGLDPDLEVLRHVAGEGKFSWNLLEGAKGVQLAELGLKSWKQRKWLDVPRLKS